MKEVIWKKYTGEKSQNCPDIMCSIIWLKSDIASILLHTMETDYAKTEDVEEEIRMIILKAPYGNKIYEMVDIHRCYRDAEIRYDFD